MLLLAAQINYSWYRWKGALAAAYFALLLLASLMWHS